LDNLEFPLIIIVLVQIEPVIRSLQIRKRDPSALLNRLVDLLLGRRFKAQVLNHIHHMLIIESD